MSTWNNQTKKDTQTSLAYNTNNTYNAFGYNYSGKLGTLWTKQIKN